MVEKRILVVVVGVVGKMKGVRDVEEERDW